MPTRGRVKLGQLLVDAGVISANQLNEAMARQRKTRERLGEALINLGLLSEEALAKTLAHQLGLPFATPENALLVPAHDQGLNQLVTEETARQYHVLPLARSAAGLTIAVMDPLDLLTLDNLRKITGKDLSPVVATRTALDHAIDVYYGRRDELEQAVQASFALDTAGADITVEEVKEEAATLDDLIAKAGEATVVKLVDLLIREAIASRASDIHIEPSAKRISIRYRIDGVLQEMNPPAGALLPAIVSRLKILSKLDIAEKRLPQDGGFAVRLSDRTVDIRTSVIPTIYGEKVVLRILDKSSVVLDFEALGISGKTREHLARAIEAPYGLLFITGPTGSGKSTTLYAALKQIHDPSLNILTIEDPVEYRLLGINQVQAKPQIGLTFAAGLRAFLRQDPDVIMVGEVRDLETAEICVRAALTGHLVLSTLHTNDAPSAITRLMDIGIEPYLLSPSLIMVLAQRLVRRLCPECKEAYAPPSALKTQLPETAAYPTLYRAKGCRACRQTGYAGRLGLYEGLYITEAIQELIAQRAPLTKIREAARRGGMLSLIDDGLAKAGQGLTSVEEVMSTVMLRGE